MNTTAAFRRLTPAIVLPALVLAGCATKGPQPTVALDVDPEQVVTLPPATGSNIPRRVKVKDALSADATKKSQTQAITAEDFQRNLPPGRQLEPSR